MTVKELRMLIDTYNELLRSHQLNIELLETLELTLLSVKNYCIKHNIPIGDAKIASLISKVNLLLDEIGQKLSDDSYHDKKSDDKLPEPVQSIYKGGLDQTESKSAKDLIEIEWKLIDKLLHMAETTRYGYWCVIGHEFS